MACLQTECCNQASGCNSGNSGTCGYIKMVMGLRLIATWGEKERVADLLSIKIADMEIGPGVYWPLLTLTIALFSLLN